MLAVIAFLGLHTRIISLWCVFSQLSKSAELIACDFFSVNIVCPKCKILPEKVITIPEFKLGNTQYSIPFSAAFFV